VAFTTSGLSIVSMWPQRGTITSCACGTSAAISREHSGGVSTGQRSRGKCPRASGPQCVRAPHAFVAGKPGNEDQGAHRREKCTSDGFVPILHRAPAGIIRA
jgi:hypothetical protein